MQINTLFKSNATIECRKNKFNTNRTKKKLPFRRTTARAYEKKLPENSYDYKKMNSMRKTQ
jgi:hypothetical protein